MTDVAQSASDQHPAASDETRFLSQRRTVHDFEPTPVDSDVVLAALESAIWAPNHHRSEPWRFYWLNGAAQEKVIALNTGLVEAAKGKRAAQVKQRRWASVPGWMVLTCQRGADALREREDYAACCCAAQNFMLHLWANGIGSKWTTGKVTRLPEFYATIGADQDRESVVGMFWYGHPAAVNSQRRRPLSEVLTYCE